MATNTKRLLLAIIILIGFSSFLSAQSANYYSVTEGGQTRFYQRLTWSGGEYALRYEVVIEREVEGRYIAHLRDSTTSLFVVVSLPPGEYRFQVITYDILDRPGERSPWVNLEVRHAVRPELMGMSSGFFSSGNDDQPSGYALRVTGNDIVPGAEVFVRHPDGTLIPSDVLGYGEGTDAIIFIDSSKVEPGEYELLIRNPGGLESGVTGIVLKKPEPQIVYQPQPQSQPEPRTEPVVVVEPEPEPEPEPEEEPKKPALVFGPSGTVLVTFGAAWTPVFPIHGGYADTEHYPFGLYTERELSILGIHIDVAFSTPMDIFIGPELTLFFYTNDKDEPFFVGGFNLIAMKWTPNQKIAFSFRPGVSFMLISETAERFLLNIGASFVLRFFDSFLLEIGLDYVNWSREIGDIGFIRPWIGLGVLF